MLGGEAMGAALPGQLADDLAVGGAEVGIRLQPAGSALLLLAQPELGVVGALGLLAGQRRGPIGRGRLDSPRPAKHPPPRPLAIGVGGELLQGRIRLGPARGRPLSSRLRSRGAWSSSRRSRSRSARNSPVVSRRRSGLLGMSIAKVWSPARARAWASWA
jgi:hypothetical protein